LSFCRSVPGTSFDDTLGTPNMAVTSSTH
jgi:hypothetical protein